MRANVLNDTALVRQARQFAWLSIDSDKPSNAGFVEKFPTEGVPVFLVIDSATEKVALSWYGSATASQLVTLLEDGKRVAPGGGSGAEALLARADELNGQKKLAEAAEFYEQALKAGGPAWPRRARTVESLVMAYDFGHNQKACAETAAREAPSLARDRSFVNTVYFGLDCAQPGAPELSKIEQLAEEGVKLPGVLGDDTSGLYMILASTYRRDKGEDAATRTATSWLHYLQGQIAKASSAETRMGYDFQLVSAALFLHQPELALADVERAERDLPRDYNPPLLLATLYREMERYDDALRACDRAMARAYGQANLRVYLARGRVLAKKGDAVGARKAYAEGLDFGRTLAEAPAKSYLDALQKSLDSIGKTQ